MKTKSISCKEIFFSMCSVKTVNLNVKVSLQFCISSCYRWLLHSGNIIGLLALHPQYFKEWK